MCDGKLDQGEWDAVLQITDGLAEGFYVEGDNSRNKSDTAQLFRTEFRYLLENIPKWEKKFLNVLKNHIRFNQSAKEFVLECMYLLANSADGISTIEQQNIESLSKRLGIVN
jgi:2-hydroxy-3-keto-5-methylthiopentenyl-1-phosphate phosphatase